MARIKAIDQETRRIWRLLDPQLSFGRVWHELNDIRSRAAASTIDALMYSLRRGPSVLANAAAMRRLGDLDERQLVDVAARLQKFKPEIAPAWAPDQIKILIAAWRKVREQR